MDGKVSLICNCFVYCNFMHYKKAKCGYTQKFPHLWFKIRFLYSNTQLHNLLIFSNLEFVLFILRCCGIAGNERADEFAKKASLNKVCLVSLPHSDYHQSFKQEIDKR